MASAPSQGVPVIGYDRLIEDPTALYITFDNVRVGELEAEAVLNEVSEGNFVIIKGNSADANADFLREGYVNAGVPPAGENSDTITIVGETYTDNWDPALAQTQMEQFLTEETQGRRGAARERRHGGRRPSPRSKAQGLAGPSGLRPGRRQGGAQPGRPRHPDGDRSGRTAASSARRRTLAAKPAMWAAALSLGVGKFNKGKNGDDMTSILLTPIPITKDTLDVVIDAGWITKEEACAGVKAGIRDVCLTGGRLACQLTKLNHHGRAIRGGAGPFRERR